jgi:hypothetical protein
VVLCNGTKAEAHAIKEELKEVLRTMGLTLSEDKTKVTHITEGFTFLGYRIIRGVGASGKMVPKVLIPAIVFHLNNCTDFSPNQGSSLPEGIVDLAI